MIIFLYGPDSFRSVRKLKEIVARYRDIHKSGLNLRFLDLEEDSFENFKDIVESASMFDEKKLIVLKSALISKEFRDKFLKWQGKDSLIGDKDAVCVLLETETEQNTPLCVWLKNNSKSQEFNLLSGVRLKNFILNTARAKGVSIDSGAVFMLMSVSRGDLWLLENEISKLASYIKRGGDSKVITKRDIETFIKPKPEIHIFSLVDSFVEGDKKRALRLLNGHFESGDSEQYLFSLIYKQFRNVMLAHDFFKKKEFNHLTIAKALGIHPFVAKKSIQQAMRIGESQIKNIYGLLLDIDVKMKTGPVDARIELERLLL